jgi:hypothetical protein
LSGNAQSRIAAVGASKQASREPAAYGKSQMLPEFLINEHGLTNFFSYQNNNQRAECQGYGLLALLLFASGANASVSQHHWTELGFHGYTACSFPCVTCMNTYSLSTPRSRGLKYLDSLLEKTISLVWYHWHDAVPLRSLRSFF